MVRFQENLPAWLLEISELLLRTCDEVYLVGGAIRNLLLGIEIDDYDFVVRKNAIGIARLVADHLGGDFYILDHTRKTARAIIPTGSILVKLDFALFNGEDIMQDLIARDFTINAMALRFPIENQLIDPTGGAGDLKAKLLKPCSESAFIDDPVRTIRFVRFLQELKLETEAAVEKRLKEAVPLLEKVSKERQRDALLDVINVSNLREAFNYMLAIGLIAQLFPAAENLQDVELSLPHTYHAWDHTMQVMHYCQQLMALLGIAPPLVTFHPRVIDAFNRLDRYQEHLQNYFQKTISSGRTKYQLLVISAFFHDLAKGVVEYELKGDRKKFPGHARRGAKIIRDWAEVNHFSNKECAYLYNIVRMHMKVSRQEMIDNATKNENALTDDRWDEALTAVDNIFSAYFFNYDQIVNPVLLVNGHDLIQKFNLQPGRQIGDLLAALQAEQAAGHIHNYQQALAFLSMRIANANEKKAGK